MRKIWEEFKEFLNKGDFVTIAVGLVMALYFQQIINSLLDGIINPIIAAIFGKPDLTSIGFDIGDARISIGLVFNAIISFVVVGFILFLILKAYTRMRATNDDRELETQLSVLREIRDELQRGRPTS
ncbi:MAG TPA: MscL family protein [Acidimicrobiales bacterium]|nr:MscL family protein [Acidimicrobiales bacterium]